MGLAISVLDFPVNRAKLVQAGVGVIAESVSRLRAGEKTIMELAASADWSTAVLVDVIAEGSITRHDFRS